MWQDVALMCIGFLFALFLIPMLRDATRGKPANRLTALTTAIGLYTTAFIYLTMEFPMAFTSSMLAANLWATIFVWSHYDRIRT